MNDSSKHEIMHRSNSINNPVILNSATVLRQPKGFPFNAQLVLGNMEAKILIKIIFKLQEPIKQQIEAKRQRQNPLQLNIFPLDDSKIHMDFELSEFGLDPSNYRNLKSALLKMQSYYVKHDTVYYNKLVNKEVEAEALMPLIAKILHPKKYDRYFSIQIEKEVAELLV